MSANIERVVRTWAERGTPFTAAGIRSMVWAEGEGEPVLCLHGVPSSAFLYRRVLPELAARGLRGIAVDLPGLGLAERPADFDYRWSSLSAWVVAALDALELDRVHLVVHDIGGPIGFDAARRAPQRIRSLTVLNTLVRVASFRRPWTMQPFAMRGIGETYLATLRPWTFERLMRMQGVMTPVPSDEIRAYVPLLKGDDGGRAFLRIMRGFELTPEFESRILAHLRDRTYPAAVAWGEHDPALPMRTRGEEVRQALGVDAVQRLHGRHFVQEDAPGEIASVVAAVAAQARSGDSGNAR
jgi:pimeloyl-ACP methyl ester carboxylesterase